MWRRTILVILTAVLTTSCRKPSEWYPLQPGDTWTYQKETLDGDIHNPDIERWTIEETILSAAPTADLGGTLITKRTKVLNDFRTPGAPEQNMAKREPPESYLLLRDNCIYNIDAHPNRDDIQRGNIPAQFCVPMALGMTWGKTPKTSPSEEDLWHVDRVNSDPYGLPGATTFHLAGWEGGGVTVDRWFAEGVGTLQEVVLHHGTYDEDRIQLLSTVIDGKSRSYSLKPARLAPSGSIDCEGAIEDWRYFARASGSPFQTLADCIAYAPK